MKVQVVLDRKGSSRSAQVDQLISAIIALPKNGKVTVIGAGSDNELDTTAEAAERMGWNHYGFPRSYDRRGAELLAAVEALTTMQPDVVLCLPLPDGSRWWRFITEATRRGFVVVNA